MAVEQVGNRPSGGILPTVISVPVPQKYTGYSPVRTRSSLQHLFQNVVVAVDLVILLAKAGNGAAGVQHGGVVAIAERVADIGQADLRQFAGQSHRHLAWPCDVAAALLRMEVGNLDLV